jgi:type II secretory pathway pseudopilin PulG
MEAVPGHRLPLLGWLRPAASESGIGLIELLIALTLLVIGVGAALSVFASSFVSLQHTSREGTALTLADRQLEAYRSMSYSCLPAASLLAPDPACATPFTDPFPNPYSASQTVTGTESPDHRTYTVTTTVTDVGTDCGTGVREIIVVVTDPTNGNENLARETSCFSSVGGPASN